MKKIFVLMLLAISSAAYAGNETNPDATILMTAPNAPVSASNPLQVTGSLSISGTGANNADGVAALTTGLGKQTTFPYLWNGAAFDRWPGDLTNGAKVNCVLGCSGGVSANNADTVATSTTLGLTRAYGYLWNGATFDRWYGDKTNGAFVNVKTSVLPTGAALDATLQSILTKLSSPSSVAVTGTFWQATQPISAASLPLPTGAALDATLQSILTKLSSPSSTAVTGTFWQATQPISAASLPLPTGAALDATLATINTSLGTINTTLGTPMKSTGGTVGLVAGSAVIGHVIVDTAPTTAVTLATAPALVASAALIGSTSTFGRIDVTPTVQNASYVSGNDMGGLISFTLPRTASGVLQSVGVQFIGGATTQVNVFCFDSNPTGSTFTDKSTFTIAAADEAKRINKNGFALTPVAAVGDTVTAAAIDNYAKPFNSTGTIYCAVVSTGTFTPASVTDLRMTITYEQGAL